MSEMTQRFFKARPELISRARGFATDALAEWGLPGRAEDIRLCVSELATAALVHGTAGHGFSVKLDEDEKPYGWKCMTAAASTPRPVRRPTRTLPLPKTSSVQEIGGMSVSRVPSRGRSGLGSGASAGCWVLVLREHDRWCCFDWLFAMPRLLPMGGRDKDVAVLALRHQIMVLERQLGGDRPRFRPADRACLAASLHQVPRDVLRRLRLLVHPDTVLRWHRDLVARQHAVRSRPQRSGRPRTVRSICVLVLRLARENPTWGYRRVHGQLLVLGIKVAASMCWTSVRDAGIDPAPARAKVAKAFSHTLQDGSPNPLVPPANAMIAGVAETVRHGKLRLLNRFWELGPPELVESTVDDLAGFLLDPSAYRKTLTTMQGRADEAWKVWKEADA